MDAATAVQLVIAVLGVVGAALPVLQAGRRARRRPGECAGGSGEPDGCSPAGCCRCAARTGGTGDGRR